MPTPSIIGAPLPDTGTRRPVHPGTRPRPRRTPGALGNEACDAAVGKDCPFCYPANGVSCATGQPLANSTLSLALGTAPTVYCLENANTFPTRDEATCEDTTAKALVEFGRWINGCVEGCTKATTNGDALYGDCAPANGAVGAPLNEGDRYVFRYLPGVGCPQVQGGPRALDAPVKTSGNAW